MTEKSKAQEAYQEADKIFRNLKFTEGGYYLSNRDADMLCHYFREINRTALQSQIEAEKHGVGEDTNIIEDKVRESFVKDFDDYSTDELIRQCVTETLKAAKLPAVQDAGKVDGLVRALEAIERGSYDPEHSIAKQTLAEFRKKA